MIMYNGQPREWSGLALPVTDQPNSINIVEIRELLNRREIWMEEKGYESVEEL